MWQHAVLLLLASTVQGLLLARTVLVAAIEAPLPTRRPNILHLMADDLRPQLQSYGHAFMKTPHLQRLAQTGLQFDFAYTQYGVCAPSRNSFMVMQPCTSLRIQPPHSALWCSSLTQPHAA
jgi:hypothetical protein